MRLINAHTLKLKEFFGSEIPREYAILSHTWEEEEVSFQEFTQLPREELQKRKGFDKINRTCKLALNSRIKWAWVDTCCIDKTSSAELTEAINSMYMWYANSAVCYAYLSDLESNFKGGDEGKDGKEAPEEENMKAVNEMEKSENEQSWKAKERKEKRKGGQENDGSGRDSEVKDRKIMENCRWFTRGWTLQELIAPKRLGFYDKDWKFQGEKSDLSEVLFKITGISKDVLTDEAMLGTVSVARRMSWASRRKTTRVEDMAYCLLGIFGVQLPLLYGEGDKAFIRLQEEIIKESNDLSLFAWRADPSMARRQKHWGVLAPSPKEFVDCSDIVLWVDPIHNSECAITSKGLRVTPVPRGGLRLGDDGSYVFNLQCKRANRAENLGVFIQQHGCDAYTRIRPGELSVAPRSERDKARPFFVSKTVSPVRSAVLSTSHRDAINLSRALETLRHCGVELLESGAFVPAGHWDGQRSLFLTCGMYSFPCCVRLWSIRSSFVLGCLLAEGKELDVKFYKSLDGADTENTLRIDPKNGSDTLFVEGFERKAGAAPTRLTLRVVKEVLGGQPVSFVVIDTAQHKKRVGHEIRDNGGWNWWV